MCVIYTWIDIYLLPPIRVQCTQQNLSISYTNRFVEKNQKIKIKMKTKNKKKIEKPKVTME